MKYSQTSLGIFYMAASSFSFALMNAFVKVLSPQLSPMENIFFRSFVMVIFVLGIFSVSPPNNKGKKKGGWGKLIFRAVIGGLSMLALFYNIATIPLGTATAFAQSVPIYTVIFSIIFLKERPKIGVIFATIIGFIGVICISNPSVGGLEAKNIFAGIFSGVSAALAFITLRSLRDYFDEKSVVFAFGITMTLIGGVGIFINIPHLSNGWSSPSGLEWIYIVAMGLAGTFGQQFLTRAYMLAPAGIVAPIDYSRIVWGVLLGLFLGDRFPDLMSGIGIILILISGVLIALPVFLRDIKRIKNV
ncbi:hypothetical protein BKH41_02410 [Helicobacter sp. 12S02232-10]|uniref:DMT family transporter n=1 Tax=Helicobacter sp. 12S02232-10 TaxID=1476197 RepID=UPI000BA5E67C|nr:DMT family transporter [Helicobacter sp. 12S02232-10]PAF49536.1 hypothetical protein BKH41_02410 [Helicobacter sp. 12S02232-10]